MHIKAVRLISGLAGGSISALQLETLLGQAEYKGAFATGILENTSRVRSVAASSTAMAAVAASSTAMAAVAASSTAMAAVIANSTAMAVVAASSTAMTAVSVSSTALGCIWASDVAQTRIRAVQAAVDILVLSSRSALLTITTGSATATQFVGNCILLKSKVSYGTQTDTVKTRYSNGAITVNGSISNTAAYANIVMSFKDFAFVAGQFSYQSSYYYINCN